MSYESWRITFQDSEQAARAAFAKITALERERDEVKRDKGELLDAIDSYKRVMARDLETIITLRAEVERLKAPITAEMVE